MYVSNNQGLTNLQSSCSCVSHTPPPAHNLEQLCSCVCIRQRGKTTPTSGARRTLCPGRGAEAPEVRSAALPAGRRDSRRCAAAGGAARRCARTGFMPPPGGAEGVPAGGTRGTPRPELRRSVWSPYGPCGREDGASEQKHQFSSLKGKHPQSCRFLQETTTACSPPATWTPLRMMTNSSIPCQTF